MIPEVTMADAGLSSTHKGIGGRLSYLQCLPCNHTRDMLILVSRAQHGLIVEDLLVLALPQDPLAGCCCHLRAYAQ